MKIKSIKQRVINCKRIFHLLPFAFCLFLTACGSIYVPNLEEAQCTESREVVKKFYSYHFGNEMKFSAENLQPREKFLTPDFVKSLQNLQTENDIFTSDSTDVPRAFRLGGCKVIEPNQTNVEVLLFWKDQNQSTQKSIQAEVVKQNDKWLINKVLR